MPDAAPEIPASPFIHALVLDGHGGARALDAKGVDDWTPADGILWVHLETANPSARQWLEQSSGLDPLTVEAIAATETRPRSFVRGDGLLVILRGVNTNPGADPEDMVSLRVWIDANRVITVRRRRLLAIQDLRDLLAQGSGPTSTGDFLVSVIERLAIRIDAFVDRIEAGLDAVEEKAARSEVSPLQTEVGRLRRQAAAVRRYLAPQRDALTRIRGRTELLADSELHDLEEQADRITLSLEDLDLAREQAMLAQEQLTARMAQEQNSRLYVLSIVAAIFLPLSFITGLLGMNVGGLPGLDYAPAFGISVGGMTVIAAGLLAYFRWKRWI